MAKMVNKTYIKHDVDSRNDEGMLTIRAKFGMEGYGTYWALVEMMREKESLNLKYPPSAGIAMHLNIDEAKLKQLVDICVAEKLFASNDEYFWSERLQKDVKKINEISETRSISGKSGGKKSVENRLKKKQMLSKSEANVKQNISNSESNVKQNSLKLREEEGDINSSIIIPELNPLPPQVPPGGDDDVGDVVGGFFKKFFENKDFRHRAFQNVLAYKSHYENNWRPRDKKAWITKEIQKLEAPGNTRLREDFLKKYSIWQTRLSEELENTKRIAENSDADIQANKIYSQMDEEERLNFERVVKEEALSEGRKIIGSTLLKMGVIQKIKTEKLRLSHV